MNHSHTHLSGMPTEVSQEPVLDPSATSSITHSLVVCRAVFAVSW